MLLYDQICKRDLLVPNHQDNLLNYFCIILFYHYLCKVSNIPYSNLMLLELLQPFWLNLFLDIIHLINQHYTKIDILYDYLFTLASNALWVCICLTYLTRKSSYFCIQIIIGIISIYIIWRVLVINGYLNRFTFDF